MSMHAYRKCESHRETVSSASQPSKSSLSGKFWIIYIQIIAYKRV